VLREGGENARVGVDSFAANLIGKVDIEVAGVNRWVRQGQKLVMLKSGGTVFELVSPVEGVVTAVNKDVVERDCTGSGSERVDRDREVAGLGNEPEEPGAGRDGGAVAAEQRDAAQWNGCAAGADDGGRWRIADGGIADAG